MSLIWPTTPCTAFALALRLLEYWGRRPTDHPSRFEGTDQQYREWAECAHQVEVNLETHKGKFAEEDLASLAGTRGAVTDEFMWAHAVAWGIDLVLWTQFPDEWHEELGRPEEYRITDGDFYPVTDWVPTTPSSADRSVRPGAEHIDSDELCHIRRWRSGSGVAVGAVFHFDAILEIDVVAEGVCFASLHPNADLSEFSDTSLFPIEPIRSDQPERILHAVRGAANRDAQLIVGGELSVSQESLEILQDWLDNDNDPPALVIPGSMHQLIDEKGRNVAYGLRSNAPSLTHTKIAPFETSMSRGIPTREGIVPGPRTISVWAGSWARFSMLICKDFLDEDLRDAAIRAGINVLAIPAFSGEMSSYPNHVGEVIARTQGRVVVANNPVSHGGSPVAPAAVFGRPYKNNPVQTLNGQPPEQTGIGIEFLGSDPIWIEWNEI